MKVTDLYRDICNTIGKGELWRMNTDELCNYIEENYEVNKNE
jgi:hypothetical protein